MMESLRGLGYSTAAALADIVDNSISAGAADVWIQFDWDGQASRVTVLDNGRGMDDAALEGAMRLGDRNPLDERAVGDLGRFGLGLKTASLSQCRRLTVASLSKDGAPCCLRWDLDALAARPDDGWLLFEGPATGSDRYLAPLEGAKSGTLVLWERMDRIVTAGYKVDDYLGMIDGVEKQLAMVFHRLLQGGRPKLRLWINGGRVAPWDPFMTGHPAKQWNSPVERKRTAAGLIEIECHVLPHKDRLSKEDYEDAGGPDGWTSQQGFYVYRNERLLLAGSWLGLGRGRAWNREEAHRLARIQLDIPNTADAEWKIDIRKSTARVPVEHRALLTKLADHTRERARKVFAFRGAPAIGPKGAPVAQAWRADRSTGSIRYKIDLKHPAVAAVLEAAGDGARLVQAMLKVIEETVPVQRIWLDTAEGKDTPKVGFAGELSEVVKEVLGALYEDMVGRKGMSPAMAKKELNATEPFQNYPDLVASLPGDGQKT